jgi:hypothetical protein
MFSSKLSGQNFGNHSNESSLRMADFYEIPDQQNPDVEQKLSEDTLFKPDQ